MPDGFDFITTHTDIYDMEQKRIKFQNVFKSHPDGPEVLMHIRNQLGVNNYDPDRVVPELIAFDHWLMYMIGVKHDKNILNETKALLTAANNADLISVKNIEKERTDES